MHRSQAREVSSPHEAERLLGQGWLMAAPKGKTNMAAKTRQLRERRRAAGWKLLTLALRPEEIALLKKLKRPGETYVQLFTRLARQSLL
ncbi:hypothetical protein [Pseudomonas indica]|uniref:hypothetical protein n=1 Tax=Pseudomonas indica TaxID=137658 RepID=UPI0023F9B347|nr:hypothetical protein [Pseudomonas indica]MBU3055844.1 hypothetical protein [Pseudomonas indica]